MISSDGSAWMEVTSRPVSFNQALISSTSLSRSTGSSSTGFVGSGVGDAVGEAVGSTGGIISGVSVVSAFCVESPAGSLSKGFRESHAVSKKKIKTYKNKPKARLFLYKEIHCHIQSGSNISHWLQSRAPT